MEEDTTTFYEVYRLPWPLSDSELVQEYVYHVDAAGQVLPGKWTEEQRAALQALADLRGPEARKPGRGNSLSEISADSPEARLSLALALAMLSPEERQAYHARQAQEKRIEYARGLVRAAHQPVCFDAGFSMGPIEEQDDGTGLVEVSDTGPNWTNRYTLYILALAPDIEKIEILQAYTPFGEHCFNHHFQVTEKAPDESNQFDNFPATLARIWRGLDWLANHDEWTAEEVQSHDEWLSSQGNQS